MYELTHMYGQPQLGYQDHLRQVRLSPGLYPWGNTALGTPQKTFIILQWNQSPKYISSTVLGSDG